jgi:hypothetical protein
LSKLKLKIEVKEKILAQLKLACGEKTSVSDRTLDKLATTLSLGVTDETLIPSIIEAHKPFLQELDGNISFIAAKAVKEHIAPATPPTPPAPLTPPAPPTPPVPPTNDRPQWAIDMDARLEALAKANEVKAQQEASAELVSKAKAGFLSKFKVSESEKSLFEKAVKIELLTNPSHADEQSMINGFKSQYEDLRSTIGLPSVEAQVAASGSNGKSSTPILDKVKADLQNSGKLPKQQQ